MLITLMNFGEIILKNAEFPDEYSAGKTISDQAVTMLHEFILYNGISRNTLSRHLASFHETDFQVGFIRSMKGMYRLAIKDIPYEQSHALNQSETIVRTLRSLSGTSKIEYLLKPNKTKSTIADIFRFHIRQAKLPYSEITSRERTVELPATPLKRKLFFMKKNSIGDTLVGMLEMLPYGDYLSESYYTETCYNATKLIIALNLYKSKNIDLPDTLDELVPEYLQSIPIDPYDNKPFRYSKENRTVYSVGKDLKDSGGEFITDDNPRQTCCGDAETGRIFLIHR